ncbi:metallophosphoesterase family protein [Streptomyces sp. AN091965]|uniref:metallophosphoesterase family protein n=1 Tax=Streptomyces sp. AN091965 TaxID=2927803 RepID=UPI001F616743|nr:metallophosphoesterase [Streptomyces sp. AN091965]MCI3934309.1 metallophosphoesterase [Streptomyces sp. AN091965]
MNHVKPVRRVVWSTVLGVVAVAGLGGGLAVSAPLHPDGGDAGRDASGAVTVAVAGDVCGSACDQTAPLITKMNPQALLTAGDNAYDSGSASDYRQRYAPYWGGFNKIVHPSPGNHEYKTSGAKGYFDYFSGNGVTVGERGKGYYSFDVGDWHMVALNSNLGSSADTAQRQWLDKDLSASTKPCTMAYWHHPRFSSGDHGDQSRMSSHYKILTDHKADVVVNGHDHHYERFAPAMADGRKDAANGLRQFVIGTGGRALYSKTSTSKGPSEVFHNRTFGVGQFDLSATGYSFTFRPVDGRTFTDSVSGTCHPKGPSGAAR